MEQMRWRDRHYIDRLKQGNRELQQQLYDDYAPVFYSSLCRLVSCSNARDQLLTEIFISIFRQLPDFNQERQTLFSWMYSIVQQHLIEWHELRERKA